jgi:hypothetical protein
MDLVLVLPETNMVLTLLEEHRYQPPLKFVQSVHTDSVEPAWAMERVLERVLEVAAPPALMPFTLVRLSVALYSVMPPPAK